MSTPTVYVICDANCKFEGMTKEQIYAAIVQAVNEGTIGNIDTGFITTVKTVNGLPLRFFVGDQAEYKALSDENKENLFAIITNDTSKEGILKAIEELQKDYGEMCEERRHLYMHSIQVYMEVYSRTDTATLIGYLTIKFNIPTQQATFASQSAANLLFTTENTPYFYEGVYQAKGGTAEPITSYTFGGADSNNYGYITVNTPSAGVVGCCKAYNATVNTVKIY